MSEAAQPTSRDAEMLARLAELDLAAAEHVHAKLMAATGAPEIADLGRTYQRMARSLRQTLALKAKLAREAATDTARATIVNRRDALVREDMIEQRTLELQDALDRVAAAAIPEPERREEVLDRFDVELDDWIEADDFLAADLDGQVRRACRLLELPEALAATWRNLPQPEFTPDPATRDPAQPVRPDVAAGPPDPWRDSG